jgi:hypothetical protein
MYKDVELKIADLINKDSGKYAWKHPWYDWFISSDIYKDYINKKLWKEEDFEIAINEINSLYEKKMYKEVEIKIADLIEKYSEKYAWIHPWYDWFIKSDIYKQYISKELWKTINVK